MLAYNLLQNHIITHKEFSLDFGDIVIAGRQRLKTVLFKEDLKETKV